jgi:hypothetical protein
MTRHALSPAGRGASYAGGLAVVVLTTAYFAYVFQLTTGKPFSFGLTDWHDSYFINALLEHWYVNLLRVTDLPSPPMFFPASGTLGYSHGLILFAPFYVAVRPLVEPFLAHTLTIWFVMELGTVCLYVLVRRTGLGIAASFLLTAFAVTSANLITEATALWSQRASVFLIPPVLLLLSASRGMRPGALRLIAAGLGGLLAALLLTQDFSTAAFAVLVSGFVVPGLLLARMRLPAGLGEWMKATRGNQPHAAWFAAGLLLILAALVIAVHPLDRIEVVGVRFSARKPWRPFAMGLLAIGWYAERRWSPGAWLIGRVRLAAASERRWAQAIVIGVALGCAVFIWAYRRSIVEHSSFPEDHLWEHLHRPTLDGHTPSAIIHALVAYDDVRTIALTLVVALLAWIPRFKVDLTRRRQFLWLGIVSLIVIALPLQFGDVSVWRAMLGWLPGIGAIRDPKRIMLVYEFASVLGLAVTLARTAPRAAFRRIALCLVAVFLVYDWNDRVFDYSRARREFEHWVETPIAVDASCRNFFVKKASAAYQARSHMLDSLYGADTLFIALRHRVPTLNGYSAWIPPNYQMLHVSDADYMDGVRAWIRGERLLDVCVLDLDARTMLPFSD